MLLLSFAVVFTWSAIHPFDYFTWFLEVVPALIALAVLVPTHRRFPLTTLLYCLIWIHAIILVIGGATLTVLLYAREVIQARDEVQAANVNLENRVAQRTVDPAAS